MKFISIFIAWLVLCFGVFAGDIDGPKQVNLGDLFILTTTLPAKSYQWMEIVDGKIVPIKNSFIANDGKTVVCSRGTPGEMNVVLLSSEGLIVIKEVSVGNTTIPLITTNNGKEPGISQAKIIIGVAPIPPPNPPVNTELWGVIIVEETGDRTPQQAKVYWDKAFMSFIDGKGWHRRICDQNSIAENGSIDPQLKPLVDKKQGKGTRLFLVGKDGTNLGEFDLKATVKEQIDFLSGYKGK